MEVIVLTGACGVGKSTVAKAWAKLKKGAVIECDYFTEWIYNPDLPRWDLEEEKFVASVTLAVCREYVNHQMPVAIENVWSPTGIQILVNSLKKWELVTTIKVVWLLCDLTENHRRDQLRIPENQMKERVDIVNKELRSYEWPAYVQVVNTSGLSVEETIKAIEAL